MKMKLAHSTYLVPVLILLGGQGDIPALHVDISIKVTYDSKSLKRKAKSKCANRKDAQCQEEALIIHCEDNSLFTRYISKHLKKWTILVSELRNKMEHNELLRTLLNFNRTVFGLINPKTRNDFDFLGVSSPALISVSKVFIAIVQVAPALQNIAVIALYKHFSWFAEAIASRLESLVCDLEFWISQGMDSMDPISNHSQISTLLQQYRKIPAHGRMTGFDSATLFD